MTAPHDVDGRLLGGTAWGGNLISYELFFVTLLGCSGFQVRVKIINTNIIKHKNDKLYPHVTELNLSKVAS